MNSVTDLLAQPISDIRHLAQSPAERSVGWLSHRNDSPLQRVHALHRLHTSCNRTAERLHILNSVDQERPSRCLALVHGAEFLQKY